MENNCIMNPVDWTKFGADPRRRQTFHSYLEFRVSRPPFRRLESVSLCATRLVVSQMYPEPCMSGFVWTVSESAGSAVYTVAVRRPPPRHLFRLWPLFENGDTCQPNSMPVMQLPGLLGNRRRVPVALKGERRGVSEIRSMSRYLYIHYTFSWPD